MKYFSLPILLLFFTSLSSAQDRDIAKKPLYETSDGTLVIDTFENDSLGFLPYEWYNRNAEVKPSEDPREAQLFRYFIAEEAGNQYLKYEGVKARHLNFPLRNRPNLNIHENPVLSWRWKVDHLPQGANEDNDDLNDTAASIYVVFDMGRVALFKKVPKSIRYTWSSSIEEGRELSKFFGNQKIVVVESGEENTGEWKTFERNIVKDYKRLFGDNPPEKPLAILILSDGDNTQTRAVAGYDDILLKKK